VKFIRLLANLKFILGVAFVLGVLLGELAIWTTPLILPSLALIMMISTTQVPTRNFLSLRAFTIPVLAAVVFNYLVLGGIIFLLSLWLMPEEALLAGFVLVVAAPPGVTIIPFTYIIAGNISFSLLGTIGSYIIALAITPLIVSQWVGTGVIQPSELLILLAQLILFPLLASRILLLPRLVKYTERLGDSILNWSMFIILFTVIGLNREIFLKQPEIIGLISLVAIASTIILGYLIDLVLLKLKVGKEMRISLVLMGTIKNTAFAAGVALALLGERASLPGAIVNAFYPLYLILLVWFYKNTDS
jgi:bile acid:Na+ symporter, BASS family